MLGNRSVSLPLISSRKIPSPWVHAGVAGAGVALGYFSYPYRENPLGATLLGAAGSVTAVGILLLVYDLFRDKRLVQA